PSAMSPGHPNAMVSGRCEAGRLLGPLRPGRPRAARAPPQDAWVRAHTVRRVRPDAAVACNLSARRSGKPVVGTRLAGELPPGPGPHGDPFTQSRLTGWGAQPSE